MTNEELTALIQVGQTEYIPRLWKQVVGFIDMQAGRYLDRWPEHYRWLRSDMVNESYFYFLKAVEKYDPCGGSFINYLSWYLKPAFETVLQGRGNRLKNEPLNQAVSLDIPLDDTEDLTLADTLIDETAEATIRRIEDMDFWKSVGKFLENALDHIRDRIGAEIIRYMYHNNCTVKAASTALYDSAPVPYEHYRKAIQQVRAYMKRRTTQAEITLIGLEEYTYYGRGLRSYKEKLFTSTVEEIAIERADATLKLSDIKNILYHHSADCYRTVHIKTFLHSKLLHYNYNYCIHIKKALSFDIFRQ